VRLWWDFDGVPVKINGAMLYLWRAVDLEGEVLEMIATERRDRKAALASTKRAMKCQGSPQVIVTDRLRSYNTAMKSIHAERRHEPLHVSWQLVNLGSGRFGDRFAED